MWFGGRIDTLKEIKKLFLSTNYLASTGKPETLRTTKLLDCLIIQYIVIKSEYLSKADLEAQK